MNSYKHAHISGVLLSLDDNGGDYYLLGIAVRNVAEWVASQPSLPNNLQLPYHLPLPIPAFNVENPLQLNVSTRKYLSSVALRGRCPRRGNEPFTRWQMSHFFTKLLMKARIDLK